MQFKDKGAIYLQIADMITDNILSKRWNENERIPSIREMAVQMEVNPNTVARTYGHLQEQGIIQNQRGIGYSIPEGGRKLAVESRKKEFIRNDLPVFFKSLELLGMTFGDIENLYKEYTQSGVVK